MKNDLTPFEKDLLRSINAVNGTNYNYKNLMEWNSAESAIDANLKEGEIKYNSLGVFVAIKPTVKPQS